MDSPKYIEYDGLRFCRDEKTGYYLNSTIRKRLHRYVWEKEVGAIPKGYHVHHIDGNKANNAIENLSIMTARGHQRLHGQEIERKEIHRKIVETKARPAAIAWHKSEAGRKWHSELHKGMKPPRYEKRCEVCGKLFQATKQQLFCSKACKAKNRRQIGADNVERTCEQCGRKFFSTKYKYQKYCSTECSAEAHKGWMERKKAE